MEHLLEEKQIELNEGFEFGKLSVKKRARIKIQPVFKIQYPMKNRVKDMEDKYSANTLLVVFT